MNKFTILFTKKVTLCILIILAPLEFEVYGQGTFTSGSTGADGAFSPTSSQTIQIPESGIFNYTTINIPANVEINFKKNSRNSPVIMLATGNVTISGLIRISGESNYGRFGGLGGPGGFKGGDGGWPFEHPDGFPGEGPGGALGGLRLPNGNKQGVGFAGYRFNGSNNGNAIGGSSYGNSQISLLIGGSGGGGESASLTEPGCGGSGGGGAILIASTTSITFQNGGFAAHGGGGCNGGSGGAVRLIANQISGPAYMDIGGSGWASQGYLRVEAFDQTGFIPHRFQDYSQGLPGPVILPNLPTLTISSVGGVNAPANPAAAFRANPDIIVPTSVSNPVTVNIQATNIPVGTVVQIMQTSDVNTRTIINSTPLAGTNASSTATATVTLPTTGMCILNASATLNALTAFGYPVHYDGERVDKVEIAANDDKSSGVFLVTVSGKRVKWPN